MPTPSPETRALIRDWTQAQRDQHGPDWTRALAERMSGQDALPGALLLHALLAKQREREGVRPGPKPQAR